MMKSPLKLALLAAAVLMLAPSGWARTPDTAYEYVLNVFEKLQNNWESQAYGSRMANSELTFVVNNQGQLVSSQVATDLNVDPTLAKEALAFLKNAAPFGAFPGSIQENQLEFHFKLDPASLQMTSYRLLPENRESSVIAFDPAYAFLAMVDTKKPVSQKLGKGISQPGGETQLAEAMSVYVGQVQEQIKAHWRLPQDYVFQRVVANIMIDRDGSLLSAMVKESSGDKTVDRAAMQAIQSAAPFNRVPDSVRSLPVQIQYIFDPQQPVTLEQ